MNETWWVNESDLDDDQKKVIALGPDGRHLITGPPGSGKTNMLILRANYLSASGRPNLLILVFTRTLREFLVSGASRYSFPRNKVQTYNSWARRLLGEHGIDVPEFENFDKDRENLLNGLNKLINEECINDQYYDAILLDEAHDYLLEEIQVIKQFSRNLFAVADLRQQIYRRDSKGVEFLKSISKTIELRYHYRNGVKICQLADGIMKGRDLYSQLEPTCHYDEALRPSSVKHFRFSKIDEQCKRVVEELETQVTAYPGELLGVICPGHKELELIKANLLNSSVGDFCIFQDSASGYLPFDSEHPICVSTVHSAKGLEFRALHILACETFHGFPKNNRNLTFTGVTRAKTSLSLYYSGNLYGYLESALAALFPRPDRPELSEAFEPRH